MTKVGYKTCSKCKVEQSVIQFCKSAKAKDGLQAYCRMCANEVSKENQGMKRAEMAELKAEMDADGELAYKYAVAMEHIKHKKNLARLKAKHDAGGFRPDAKPLLTKKEAGDARSRLLNSVVEAYEKVKGKSHVKTDSQETIGSTEFGVRSPEPESFSHPG